MIEEHLTAAEMIIDPEILLVEADSIVEMIKEEAEEAEIVITGGNYPRDRLTAETAAIGITPKTGTTEKKMCRTPSKRTSIH